MVYSQYKKQRALHLYREGFKSPTITKMLGREGLKVSKSGVLKFLKRYNQTGSISRKPGSGRPCKISPAMKALIDDQMEQDDETTAMQIHALLVSKGYESVSRRSVLRCRTLLGWTFRGSAYCQLIRTVNKQKRLAWATTNLAESQKVDCFEDVIWSDESSVQLETHRRHACRRVGQRPKLKPRAKHPTKVHVWAGISFRGATSICIFEGKMNAELYGDILEKTLLPFINQVYPNGHKLMQDNDPKHTSRYIGRFFAQHNVNWWKTPPESPDCNPIENMWHELKEYLRRQIKPRTKDELISGIEEFWNTVDRAKCRKYIRHLRKVLPRAIELGGDATGY